MHSLLLTENYCLEIIEFFFTTLTAASVLFYVKFID